MPLVCLLAALASAAATSPAAAASPPPPSMSASSAIIIDRVSGRVLWGKGKHQRRPMASCTKIMTALLVVERCRDLTRVIRAPQGIDSMSGIGLVGGDRITIRQALLAMMVKSANDAGYTLACSVAGSEKRFVRMMNRRAAKLKLRDTHYDNCTGSIHDRRHVSSVYDLAMLGRYAMRNARFRDIAGRLRATIHWQPNHVFHAHGNNLLLYQDWADGIKCGYTPVAGYCLVGSGKPGLRALITATLHAPDRKKDALDHQALFAWGSSLYEELTIVTAGDEVTTVPVEGGGSVSVVAATTFPAVVRTGGLDGGAVVMHGFIGLAGSFKTPPAPGTPAGSVVYKADGVKLGTVPLVVATPPPPPTESPSPASDPF